MPTWVGVVGALSLAVLAAAGVVLAATHLVAARRLEQFAHLLEQLAGPAVSDVRQLVATIRTEADGLAGTSRELRAVSSRLRTRRKRGCRIWMRCSTSFRRRSSRRCWTSPPRCAACGAASRSWTGVGAR